MEIKPVMSAQPPAYPRKEDVGVEQIKTSIPQRWMMTRAARVALGALAAMSLTGCSVAQAAELTATPASASESTAYPVTATPVLMVTAGMPKAPAIPIWPFFIASAGILAAAIWFFRRKKFRKKGNKHIDDDIPEDDDISEGDY